MNKNFNSFEDLVNNNTMMELIVIASKLGIKVDKKGAKAKAAEKIWDAMQTATAEQEEQTAESEAVLVETATEEQTEEQEEQSATEEQEEQTESEQETPKKERKPRERKENPLRPVFKDWVTEISKNYGFSLKTWESQPNLWQIKGEKTVAEIRWSLKGWMINTKQITADAVNAPYYLQTGYNLPAVIKLQYDDLGKDIFEAILIQTA